MRHWFIVFAGLLVTSCSSDVANRYYGTQTYPAKPITQVEILMVRPDRDFIVIADFQSRGETPEDLQQKAAEIGADAVLVKILGGQYDLSEQWASKDSRSHTYTRIVGTAIRYK